MFSVGLYSLYAEVLQMDRNCFLNILYALNSISIFIDAKIPHLNSVGLVVVVQQQ